MVNTKKILKALRGEDFGMNITSIIEETNLTRDNVRIALSFLLGAKEIKERRMGMSKIYLLKNG